MEKIQLFTSLTYFFSIVLMKNIIESLEVVKGIRTENANLYKPGKNFLCLDGTYTIPYSYINDDYCDCLDASDEPGTSACPNGTFYCLNAGHIPIILPSSRVNDGICDCCDGSDEWANLKKNTCQNICEKLYHIDQAEANRVHKMYEIGYQIRMQLIAKGKYLLTQKQKTIFKLLSKQKDAQFIRNTAFSDKEIAKKKESQELEKEKLKMQNKALNVFNIIDANKNKKIEEKEIMVSSVINQNNEPISKNEINYFMGNKTELDLKDFMSSGWNRLQQLIFSKLGDANQYYTPEINVEKRGNNKNLQYSFENIDVAKINELSYSEDTKILINESRKAHELFEGSDKKFKYIQRKIFQLQKSINNDYGPENEFAAFDGQCYELSHREYLYKLCLFNKITQKQKNGDSEVILGVWKNWSNGISDEPKYHTMFYDGGQNCGNNSPRFAYVHLNCGIEPKITSVTEPNLCEYIIEFDIPSVCVMKDTKYLKEAKREEL